MVPGRKLYEKSLGLTGCPPFCQEGEDPAMHAKTHCLLKIAQAFENSRILWGLGASMMLYCRGLVGNAADLDLVIAPECMAAANEILSGMGQRLPAAPRGQYATRAFYEYEIHGVAVDAMAGMTLLSGGEAFHYTLLPQFLERVPVKGVSVPMTALEDWYLLYMLMEGREAKVRLLEAHFSAHGLRREVLAARLEEPLPPAARQRALALYARFGGMAKGPSG